MITREPREIINKYGNNGVSANIAVGLRPSGIIHLGNMATMGLAGYLTSEIGPHLSQLNLTICDLDMPDAKDWSVLDNGYMKYFAELPDKDGCHDSLLSHAREGIDSFVGGLEKELGIKTNTLLLSEIQRKDGFRKGLKNVLDAHLTRQLNERVPSNKALVYPLCPICHTSNPIPSDYKDGELVTECSNPDCDQGKYSVNVLDLDFDLAVHYFIDPLRDKLVAPYSDIHVFGGDYLSGAGGNKTKLDKILKVMEVAGEGNVPDILVGPTFYGADGSKMSKSKDNGLTTDKLSNHFGEEYLVPRILEMIHWIDHNGIKVMDFSIAKDKLFEKRN